jgi:hypothetical protein
MNMKKTYIAPEMQVIEMEMESVLMSMSSSDLPGTSDGGESSGGMYGDANDRRGTWGNLWD